MHGAGSRIGHPAWLMHGGNAICKGQYGGPVLDGAYGLAMSPDGYYLWAAGSYDSAIAVFGVDSDNDGGLDVVKEAGPGADDGNGDGQSDSRQSNVVTLHFADGKRGDDILIADGMLVDIGAPTFRTYLSHPSSGSNGGGCFLTTRQ